MTRRSHVEIINESMEYLSQCDPEVGAAVRGEFNRQRQNIELIASENIVSPAVMLAMGSCLTNKYAEGYPGHRYYGGCQEVDKVEDLARQRACELFGAEHANVQPHSGSNANFAAYTALLKLHDTVLSLSLREAGHLTHGAPVNNSGKYYNFAHYPLDPETETIDYDVVRDMAHEYRPKLIVAGASAYPREIDFRRFREIADEVGAYLMVDMAHIAGLVAAGLHMNPVPYADVVTSTTHKTLRGPRGGLILCRKELAKKIDSAIFPASQGGPLEHIIAAKAVCFGEALKPEFKEYQKQVVKNAKVLSEELMKNGFKLISNGTDNHLMLIDLRNMGLTGRDFEHLLDEVCITVNKNAIIQDPEKPTVTSGVRVGTPAVTSRGFKEPEMVMIAKWMKEVATEREACIERVRKEVQELTAKYPIYE